MEKITFIKRDNTDREGNELISKKTKQPYTRLTLKVESKGDRYISGFESPQTKDWRIGDSVDIMIKESDKTDRDNKPYLNFSVPKKEQEGITELKEMIMSLKFAVGGMKNDLKILYDTIKPKKPGVPDARYPHDNETAFDEPSQTDEYGGDENPF